MSTLRALLVCALFAAPAAAATLTVDGNQTFQTIDGFGTNINSLSWTNDNSKAAIDLLAGQMGQTLWRVVFDMMDWESANDNADPADANWAYYSPLYSNPKFQNLWGTLRYLNQLGFDSKVVLSFMGPFAPWLGGATVSAAQEDEAVEEIVTLVLYARTVEHVHFGLLDPFNESDWNGNEGPQLSAAQYVRLLSKLSARFDALGFSDLRFVGPNTADVNTGVQTYAPAMLNNPTVKAKLAHFGFHSYSASAGGADSALRSSGLSFWMTEYAVPEHAFSLLQQNASGLIVWEGFDSIYNHALARGEPAVPGNDDVGSVPLEYVNTTPTSYAPRKEFYLDAQIFKFVPPGSVRIGATSNGGNLETVAFWHRASGRVTLVVHNAGATTTVTTTLRNLPPLDAFAQVKTDATNDFVSGPDLPVSSNTVTFTAPGNGIITLTAIAVGTDAGVDAGTRDAGSAFDAGTALDAGATEDAGLSTDAGTPPDAGAPDAGSPQDAGAEDAGVADGGAIDTGPGTGVTGSCGCSSAPTLTLIALLALLRRAKRV